MNATATLQVHRRTGPHRLHEEWDDSRFEPEHRTLRPSSPPDPEWVAKLNVAVKDISKQLALSFRMNQLEVAVERLETRQSSLTITLQTLAPWPAKLLRNLEITVRPSGDYWMASLFDANLHASGDTETEAIDNLKVAIVDEFEMLSSMSESVLGPEMLRQRRVLSEFVELADEPDQGSR